MRLHWTAKALDDLASINEYIAQENPEAAARVVTTLVSYTERQLAEYPRTGRQGRVAGTLELVIPKLPYIVPYRIKAGQLEILRVYHAARLWPDQL